MEEKRLKKVRNGREDKRGWKKDRGWKGRQNQQFGF